MSLPSNHEPHSSSSYPQQPCRQFTLAEIKLATRNFDESRLLGSGGFAKVYRGTINYGERLLDVAIKRLKPGYAEGASGFWYEVAMLYNLKHPHLVSQIGYCSDEQEMIFVYDYMPLGTLEDCLHKGRVPLSWVRRIKICLEAARGLEYLHTESDTKSMVLHLHLKSSNILLAYNLVAKISDFGMSKVRPIESAYVTDHVGGTLGYLDPHFQQNGKASRKTDVYAFGVVMFEVLCGKKAYTRINGVLQFLRSWAQDYVKKGKLKQIIDPLIERRISSKCLKRFVVLANNCLHNRPEQRPTITEIVKNLESILTLQLEADDKSLMKIFGARTFTAENYVGVASLEYYDRYLYTAVCEDRILHRFNLDSIVQETKNLYESYTLPLEEYRYMYKGMLQNGQIITIAQYSTEDEYKECKNEASILVKLEHENVIQLLGYYINRTSLYLVYDFAANATLANLLFDPECDVLDWNRRYKIILGIARGLVYLHNIALIPIVHADVKPENILLNEKFEPKLSGFQFAKEMYDIDDISEDSIDGTLVYSASEIFLVKMADVHGFGVLILSVVTGRREMHDGIWLCNYVAGYKAKGTLSDIIDPKIDNVNSIMMIKFIEIGLMCVQTNFKTKPTMEKVVEMLLDTMPQTLDV